MQRADAWRPWRHVQQGDRSPEFSGACDGQRFRLLRDLGPKEFKQAGAGPTGRRDVAESSLKVPNLVFDDKLVLDDGKQRVEFMFLGHAHTSGDAFAYLPRQKMLCTGDACVNGAYNFMGHGDSASWVRVLDCMQQFDVKLVCPGLEVTRTLAPPRW